MIDFEGVKQKANLLDLVGGLKKVASTGGGEYAGSCPFYGFAGIAPAEYGAT